jgi:hypothetical protein
MTSPFSNQKKLSSTPKQRIERLDVRDHIVISNKTKVVTVLAIPLDPLIGLASASLFNVCVWVLPQYQLPLAIVDRAKAAIRSFASFMESSV